MGRRHSDPNCWGDLPRSKAPLFERKALLRKLIAKTDIQFSDNFEIDGRRCLSTPARSASKASSRRSRTAAIIPAANDWVKVTCAQRETLPIAGFALKDNRFDGLYIGRHEGDELIYAGKVDHGFDKISTKDLQARLKPLIRKTQPYAKKIAHRGVWVEPSLLAEIEYRAKSAAGKVRHPFFKGIREDL